jgi:peptidyl-prolyl cis-trans isomerase SurA
VTTIMKRPVHAPGLACAALAIALAGPAAAQGLRVPSAPVAARPADTGPRAADYIVAVVNSEPITNNEVRYRMIRFAKQMQQQGQPLPPANEFAQQVLERLISEKAQLQLAQENGVRVEEGTVDLAEQGVARQNQVGLAELRRRMVADGMTVAQFREDLRNQLILTRLRERELESKVKVSDLEIDQFIHEQKQGSRDLAAQELNLAHILVAVPENANVSQVAALQARAQRIQERARAGEDFATLAREFSDAPDAKASGGLVGMRTADRYPPLFVQAVESLPVGGISELVRSGAGFHVIKVVEKKQSGLAGMTVSQTHARHILLRPTPQLTESVAIAKLEDIRKRIEGGADFAQLAKEFSQDASGPNGGDLGWSSPGMYVPEFEEAMNSLAPRQVSQPVVSRFGVHLIQVLERRQAKLTEREQREVARNVLREKKLEEAYLQWAQEVRGRAYVEMREPPR